MGFYDSSFISDHEHLYEMACMSEANWLLGSECQFSSCRQYVRDIESDYIPEVDDPVTINIVLDEYPKRTLEKMNWLAEGEDLPYLAYISNIIFPKFVEFRRECSRLGIPPKKAFDQAFSNAKELLTLPDFYIRVSKFSLVELPYVIEVAGTQKFRVMDLQGDQLNPFIWICKLAPHRDQVDLIPNNGDFVDDHTSYNPDHEIVGHSFLKLPNKHASFTDNYPDGIPRVEIPEVLDPGMGVKPKDGD